MTRDAFLARVRGALGRTPDSPRQAPPEPAAPVADWDGAALLELFTRELEKVGGRVHRVPDPDAAARTAARLLGELGARSLLVSAEPEAEALLAEVDLPRAADPAEADVGVTGVLCAIARSGTLVLSSAAGRRASLLPLTHLAVLRREQLVPTLAEALVRYGAELPSAWVQATGPSRTADIELTLSTGVHGPGVVHVIAIAAGEG